MKKEFYIGQPLIVKDTGRKVIFADDDGDEELPCNVLKYDGYLSHEYYEYEKVEPSTEFKFSEIVAGLEQGYFDVGTEFVIKESPEYKIEVSKGECGLFLKGVSYGQNATINSRKINKLWQIVEPSKEMTLEEIEAELGYKIKLKN